jgi:DNA-binding NarL/FixJ family response regulator
MGAPCRVITPPTPTEPKLTPKQIAILQWIAHGKHNTEIALLMNIASERAVQQYLVQIMDLTGTATRAAAVAYALRHKLIT